MEMRKEEPIGKVIATEKEPTTIDSFCFWTKTDTILHPFDVVKVNNLKNSITYGVVEEISHITDSASFLASFISNDFGNAEIDDTTFRIGMNCVKVKVVGNTKHIDSPVTSNQRVYLASREQVKQALGLDNIKNPVICGYLEMYEDAGEQSRITLPVNMNCDFLIGPEGAHLNISGISGLAAKTSYGMFLLKCIQDKFMQHPDRQDEDEGGVAIVVFNVKGKDLLAIDEINDFGGDENLRKKVISEYESLGLTPKPFENVKYLYPYSDHNVKNTYADKTLLENQRKKDKRFFYKFDYESDKQNLDLMFADVDDPNQTMDSIINFIVSGQGPFANIREWNVFIEKVEEMGRTGGISKDKEISVLSWRKFARMIKKSISNNCLFGDTTGDEEVRIADMIHDIRENDVFVVDMAKLGSSMQSFVFGNTIREIMDYQLGEKPGPKDGRRAPSRIIIFIDELNKYASTETPKNSPILRQILEIAERGRSLGVILFGAEQFMSAIHSRVTGNCAAFAYGRTNAIEVSKTNYKYIPKVYQNMMTRLKQGEYIVQSFSFNSLLHIKFPLPIYRQFK
jgi:DNA helicase HerA-like ATPase